EAIKQTPAGAIELEMNNVPAFTEERFAPPDKELKSRLDFFYREEGLPATGDRFWKDVQKKEYGQAEDFISRRDEAGRAAAALVASGDTAEQKLRKLYAKVQSLRNVTYEREKTEQEDKRDKSKNNKNADDVLARGYGDRKDMTGLFVAMARAAGFESYMVKVSERDETFFNPGIIN